MKYILTESKLQSVFNSMIKEYSDLEKTEKSYDWYNYDKNRYVDFNCINFYEDIEEDWEDDSWILQYQSEHGHIGTKEQLPILRYSPFWPFKNQMEMFGERFETLLKNWFEETYNLPVKTVTTETE